MMCRWLSISPGRALPPLQIDEFRRLARELAHVAVDADGAELSPGDGDGAGDGVGAVQRAEVTVE